MKKTNYFKQLNSIMILGLLFLVFSIFFSQLVYSCELSITPSDIDVTANESKTLLIIRKQIHKKCIHNANSVVISYENCELISQSDWVIEGLDSKKEITVFFPLAGRAYVTVSNTCDLFPIRPFKAVFTVSEVVQEKPVPPSETTPPPSEPIPPEEKSPDSPTELPPSSSKPENPPSSTPNNPPYTPSEPVKTTTQPVPSKEIPTLSQDTKVVPPAAIISPSDQTAEVPVAVPLQKETKWTDFFMRYQFYVLTMLLLLSILLNVTLKSNFRPVIQLISVGYLGFFTGGCLCVIGLVEKAALFRLTTAMGIFSFIFLGILFIISVFFGRVFCGWVCPHGALQEFLFRFPLRKNPHHKNKLTVFIPGLVFLSVFLVSFFWRISLICEFDPFTVPFQLGGSTVVIVLFLIIAFFSLLFFRPFCKFLCPLGFILGIASWIGDKLKIRWIGKSVQCTTCARCKKECSSQALIEHGQELYISSYDCIECGNCHQRCSIQNNLDKKKLLKQ